MYKIEDFNHQDIIKFILTYLKSEGIDIDSPKLRWKEGTYEQSFQTMTWQYPYLLTYYLPAPFGIGNICMCIDDDKIRFRYMMMYERKLINQKDKELYKTDILHLSDSGWNIMIPNIKDDEYYWDNKYGTLHGIKVNSNTLLYIINFIDKVIFNEENFICGYSDKLKAKVAINEEDRETFWDISCKLWNQNEYLWSLIPEFQHRYDDWTKYNIERRLNING